MSMLRKLGAGALLLFLSPVSLSFAGEELAPGFDSCMNRSEGVTVDMLMCLNDAYDYWDDRLNDSYAAAMKHCSGSDDPVTCKKNLRDAERLWVQYKNAMGEAVAGLEGGGTLSGVTASSFMVEETKKQAELLDRLAPVK